MNFGSLLDATARICNSILLTLEALISLLQEINTIGKNLDKIRSREGGERDDKGRSPLTNEEIIVDALLLSIELITRGDLYRQRERSQ